MIYLFATSSLNSTLGQSKTALKSFTGTYFSGKSVIAFIIALTVAIVLGRLIATVMRGFAKAMSVRADKSQNLREVNRLRRIETLIILAVAFIRTVLVIVALYLWWIYAHPAEQPTALIGAGALALIIASGTIGPLLRDVAYGGVMMAEHWFGVGDFVKIEPFADLEGVVERVTLRSTKMRGLSGEIIWLNNQYIQGVRISPKGVRTMAIDLFITNIEQGLKLVESTNLQLPTSPLMVARPLVIMEREEVGRGLWHITAVGETAPGREWLLETYAIRIMQELDESNRLHVLATEPIARYADVEADKRYTRNIQNARKSPLQRRRFPSPETLLQQMKSTKEQRQSARKRSRRNKP